MDHWGDPWADNHADGKSPTKDEVTSPLPPTHAPAPVLLNGFLDDAGWGNEDDGFGEWATSSSGNNETATNATNAPPTNPSDTDDAQWATDQQSKLPTPIGTDDWSGAAQDDADDLDNVLSETSDASTTIQPPDTPAEIEADASESLQPDDSSSARPSTSPSETSRVSVPVESPRTSIEDDRGAGKVPTVEHIVEADGVVEIKKETREINSVAIDTNSERVDDGSRNLSEDMSSTEDIPCQVEITRSIDSTATESSEDSRIESDETIKASPHTTSVGAVSSYNFTLDLALLDQLLPSPEVTKELEEAPDDPIYSTTGRKAWYRLTRRQTLRAFNNGAGDDNHIRVTWANSNIRAEVNKIVGRWAREDRISGTGPGARASFYWDTSAPLDLKTSSSHSRTKSSMPPTRAAPPVRQSLPPLPTITPAAFNWSSPASADPWKQDSPGLGSMSSPIALEHFAVNGQTNEAPALSMEPTSQSPNHTIQEPTSTPIAEAPTVTNLLSPPIPSMPAISPDTWGNLSSLDNNTSIEADQVSEAVDDDDDWGEMVTGSTASTPTATETISQLPLKDTTLPMPASTLSSVKVAPAQNTSADTMHALPIVRLKSMISPSSALFGAKSYVPRGVEQGPIGPSILKPVNRAVSASPETSKKEVHSWSGTATTVNNKEGEENSQLDGSSGAHAQKATTSHEPVASHSEVVDDFSAFASSTIPEPDRPSTPSPPATASVQLSADSWADADFSFFESPLPPTILAPSHTKHDPSDPFSVFDITPSSASAMSLANPGQRSPPRDLTPPPSQPLSGVTKFAQRQKAEEDDIIKSILDGLPDLNYMLR
ncbi:uncharacterized protein K460DRAFT_275294 [Cucurbitaria berberidis CBS 394.84]|uniref:Uncharacterized protein n=1 Tax=Cucurbitaria berberidis CBS 394.84 TaxID=1168544 RepID=A0A9P4GK68_9PLEO|nr:uncharacterized protein K460DRAFT_275294 [Cucurbitaria berberidis CBS 394.84]KAF1847813.1 hypothetical protein K460DRAFT_275294 [Cucurbitaria berberidis CBS 394.84]